MKTKIDHITWENALPHIVNDGIVKLEGSTLEELIKSGTGELVIIDFKEDLEVQKGKGQSPDQMLSSSSSSSPSPA